MSFFSFRKGNHRLRVSSSYLRHENPAKAN